MVLASKRNGKVYMRIFYASLKRIFYASLKRIFYASYITEEDISAINVHLYMYIKAIAGT